MTFVSKLTMYFRATQGKSQGRKRKLEEDEESNTSFTLLSDNEAQMDSDKV